MVTAKNDTQANPGAATAIAGAGDNKEAQGRDDGEENLPGIDTEEFRVALDSAMLKISSASARFNSRSAGPAGLRGFAGGAMSYAVFYEQLRRTFGIQLTRLEQQAMGEYFDEDGDGTINAAEFQVLFFKLHLAEKASQEKAVRAYAARKRAQAKRKLAKIARREKRAMFACASSDFTAKDSDRAMQKLTAAAMHYSRRSVGAGGLQAFEGRNMEPQIFREQLRTTFGQKFSRNELGALIHFFDRDGNGTISCAVFLAEFFKLGRVAKTEQHIAARDEILKRRARAQREMLEKTERESFEAEASMAGFSNEDLQAALAKISAAAHKHDRRSAGAGALKGFEGGTMSPQAFREQLRRTFSIKLNHSQLGAVVAHFDRDGDRNIDNAEFLNAFFRMSRQPLVRPPCSAGRGNSKSNANAAVGGGLTTSSSGGRSPARSRPWTTPAAVASSGHGAPAASHVQSSDGGFALNKSVHFADEPHNRDSLPHRGPDFVFPAIMALSSAPLPVVTQTTDAVVTSGDTAAATTAIGRKEDVKDAANDVGSPRAKESNGVDC